VSEPRAYRHYDLIMVAFVVVLLCSNLIGAGKSCTIAGVTFGACNVFFPISYIFGDVLTEVYGYARGRRVIWAGFAATIFATLMTWVVLALPVNPAEPANAIYQPALEVVFGNTWRLALGSILAFWVGDFANAYVLARLKVLTRGRHLWARTIGSTIVGQGLDSFIIYPIAFLGIWSTDEMLKVCLFNWAFKVGIEVVFTPATYAVVGYLKRAEGIDHYDTRTDFNPFRLHD
jgi:uncharacterized integral membrane protein (TIGR00697 family)